MLTDTRINAALDAITPTSGSNNIKLSVHNAYSATGANLISGPAKTAGTLNAASSRSRALNAAVNIASIPAAAVVRWIGMWDATTDTIFLGMFPNGGSDKSFQLDVATNDRIYCEGHGLVNDDKVVFHDGTAPTPATCWSRSTPGAKRPKSAAWSSPAMAPCLKPRASRPPALAIRPRRSLD